MSEIFLSWSKDRSLTFAKALKELMAGVLKDPRHMPLAAAGPGDHLVSLSQDLPKGANWFANLAGILENARAGIICVTPENCSSPWLLFEAGALIRCDVDVALFPVLLDLPTAFVDGPLSLVQGTIIERDPAAIKREIKDLILRVKDHVNQCRQPQEFIQFAADNSAGPDPWDAFATAVLQIPPASVVSIFDDFPQRFERNTFREPFQECADQRWLDRYAAACAAHDVMEMHKPRIEAALPAGGRLAYERLRSEVHSYAMAIAGQLLDEHKFGRDDEGRLEDSEGRLAVCERRREAIQAAYLRLRDPIAPVFDDARIFEELSDLQARKTRLIHPLEQRLEAAAADGQSNPAVAQNWQLEHAAISPWLYDRLVFYLHAARAQDVPSLEDLMKGLERELTLLETSDEPGTLVGLYYALEAVDKRGADRTDRTKLLDLLDRTENKIEGWNEPCEKPVHDKVDANHKVRGLVGRMRKHLDS